MLRLTDVIKDYKVGGIDIHALRGVSLEFRKSEFVAVLGPSGCGKTTMLNIVGGLDRYTSGDLIINGVSTKEYKDVDWDIYRNNSVGFVFQSYNLIPHQTVLSNVELAMTLAGTSRSERRKRAVETLEQVGLGDQLHKKPTQLSGGQMQRVAIARALVNNPDILLADEPTGALDSVTSAQIMDILRDIAKDRLVVMVTHNKEIAEIYANRVIKLMDGKVIDDSNPYSSQVAEQKARVKRKKISMSFPTALSLSLNNLLTKKTRTLLTSFAGSIGIIGIALIMSLSSGMQSYINRMESDTLSTYPIELQRTTMDMTSMLTSLAAFNNRENVSHGLDKVYSNGVIMDMVSSVSSQVIRNDLGAFKRYLDSADGAAIHAASNSIKYSYGITLQIFKSDTTNGVLQVNPSDINANLSMMSGGGGGMSAMFGSGSDTWEEMLDNDTLLHSQYNVIAGRWPEAFDEIVVVVDENNEIIDINLYSLGLLDAAEIDGLMQKVRRGETFETTGSDASFSYDEILGLTFKLILNTDYYVKETQDGRSRWVDKREDEAYMKSVIADGIDIKVVGIIRPDPSAAAHSINGAVAHTAALTDYVINAILDTEIAKAQLADPDIDVFSGVAFDIFERMGNLTIDDVYAYLDEMPETEQGQARAFLEAMPEEELIAMMEEQMKSVSDISATYDGNLSELGIVDFNEPGRIGIYPKDFDSKNTIVKSIDDYNTLQKTNNNEDAVIHYTDIVGLMTSSISSIIDIVSYVLIAFVAISLVVSSIMIAIITYISVLERTKEIGILRSIGASKKDITRVFNAETIIEGFVAGTLGIVVTILLNFPVNAIIESISGIPGISALPVTGAVGLIIISVLLTVIAGFIPSRMAAKKDPVEALRTE